MLGCSPQAGQARSLFGEQEPVVASQYSLERHLALRRSDYNASLFAAAPAPASSTTSVVMKGLPYPFPVLKSETTEERLAGQRCARCNEPLRTYVVYRPAVCDHCGE